MLELKILQISLFGEHWMMGDGYIPNVSFILDAIIDFTCFCFMLFLFIMIMYLE